MAILIWVSQRALWLRRISLAVNFRRSLSAHFLFDLQCRLQSVSPKYWNSYLTQPLICWIVKAIGVLYFNTGQRHLQGYPGLEDSSVTGGTTATESIS